MSLQRPLHRYANLPDNSIRLLRLLPHQDEDAPIQCQLFNFALENSSGTRPYEALSYVWGSDHGSQSISIDDCYLPVGGNLFAALLHLRDPSIERILWIDAVCINQQDKIEKGHQVQSMAKIYAKATRVIVWLGKATPDIDQALEDIRIAGFKQTKTLATNEEAVLKLLEAAWFRRVWILQEVAAAQHIVVRCGPAEIDGYVFFSGLSALELPYQDYPGLRPLILSVAYLGKRAVFRSRCTTSQAGRFSLDICHLGQLVDMYHHHEATDGRDRIYALLGMSSDDPATSGLLVDYDISWAKLFKQLVNFILGSVPVNTWDEKAIAVIRSKGCVLGLVSSVKTRIDRNVKQQLQVDWNSRIDFDRYTPCWELEASAEPVKQGDLICLLQGATLPTIIRMHGDYWNIIVVAAASTEHLQDAMSDDESELSQLPTIFPHDFLLVWDWDLRLDESHRGDEYEDLMKHLAPKSPEAGLQTDYEKITRFWNSGVAMRDAETPRQLLDAHEQRRGGYVDSRRLLHDEQRRLRIKDAGFSIGEENLRKAIGVLEHVLRNMDSSALAGLCHDHRMTRDDMKQLQGIVDLMSKSKGGWTSLCLAAEAGCETVARLLLNIDQTDPNARDDWGEAPLLKAARNGHERIVKLLLSADKINPDTGLDQYPFTPLAIAARYGHEAIGKLLINTRKVDVNAASYSRTPLMCAAKNGHTAVVELLLSTSEVNPDFSFRVDDTEETALSLAVENGHEAIVELLLGVSQAPVDFKDGDSSDFAEWTLLGRAKERQYRGIVTLLQRASES